MTVWKSSNCSTCIPNSTSRLIKLLHGNVLRLHKKKTQTSYKYIKYILENTQSIKAYVTLKHTMLNPSCVRIEWWGDRITVGKWKYFLTKAATRISRPFLVNASCKHAATSLPTWQQTDFVLNKTRLLCLHTATEGPSTTWIDSSFLFLGGNCFDGENTNSNFEKLIWSEQLKGCSETYVECNQKFKN